MTASLRKVPVTADFLAEGHRFSAEVILRAGPLIDMLNDATTSYLRVEHVYISPITDPAALTASHTAGQIRKDNLSIVITTPDQAISRRPGAYTQGGQVTFDTFMTVPGFEIRGGIRLELAVDVERLFIYGSERFVAVFDATATATTNPSVQFTGGAILVNRSQIGIFCMDKRVA
jgi:hypothetical protein